MTEQELVDGIIHELMRAELAELPLDGPHDGGFAVQPGQDVIYVTWSPAEELSTVAFGHLADGDPEHPIVLHVGRIKFLMADAIIGILCSAGFKAAMSADDMSPATVEIRLRDERHNARRG